MTGKVARTLVAAARRRGHRQDTGAPSVPTPDGGTHFVTVIKPEVLRGAAAADAIDEAIRLLGEADVSILRCVVMPARDFAARGYLLAHYPRLHRIAVDGTRALSSRARRELTSFMDSSRATSVMGAFEAMTHDIDLSPAALEARCRHAGIHKLGSGSYASVVDLKRRPVAVLNGFLPDLALSYTELPAQVGLLECHSPREILDLRTNVLGALHPDEAAPTSLRGALGALVRRHRSAALYEGRNGVHLSAGHLEGMFQAWRYFGVAEGSGIASTALGRSLAKRAVSMEVVAALGSDHNLTEDSGEMVAPHGATENLTRDEVLARVQQWTVATNRFDA